jgi:ribosomal protein S3
MFFLKDLFFEIIKLKSSSFGGNYIQGVKILINGRILGKLRSSSSRLIVGSIPIKTISANIQYSQNHVYTVYGAFGLKLWVNYQ